MSSLVLNEAEAHQKYYSVNILSVNRFIGFPYEKQRKYHSDVHGGVIVHPGNED